MLRSPGEVHEGQLRRARKALTDLTALLVDDAAAASGADGVASFLSSHRNRSFGCARASPSRTAGSAAAASAAASHFRSLSRSVSRTWSAARQLQAIGAGLAAPRAHEAWPGSSSGSHGQGRLPGAATVSAHELFDVMSQRGKARKR